MKSEDDFGEQKAKHDYGTEETIMASLISKEKRAAPAARKTRPGCHAIELAHHAQRKEIHNIIHSTGAQTKLTIGQSNDKYEHEAGRVADEAMRMPNPQGHTGLSVSSQPPPQSPRIQPIQIQRMCPECEEEQALQRQPEEEEEELQAKEMSGQTPKVTPNVEFRINSLKGEGQQLDSVTRSFFEPRFGHDFSQVRVHADSAASETAKAINARAYTVGNNVVFADGQFDSHNLEGQKLLAHELTHVVQQRAGIMRAPDSLLELEVELEAKRLEREELRLQMEASQAAYINDLIDERTEQMQAQSDAKMRSLAQGDVQRAIPQHAVDRLRRAITISEHGGTYLLQTKIELSYAALNNDDARIQATADIPRLVSVIRSTWRTTMSQGRYAGSNFQIEPEIVLRYTATPRDENKLHIIIRGEDDDPSSGEYWKGEISLSKSHMEEDEIVTVGHELYHLFGYFDAYGFIKSPGEQTKMWVGRDNPANNPDLLGYVGAGGLQRRLEEGKITQAQFDRQTAGTPTVWADDAEDILYALGVLPLANSEQAEPDQNAEDYFRAAKGRLEALRADRERELAKVRRRLARTNDSLNWLDMAERAMVLDAEIADLESRMGESGQNSPSTQDSNP